jgi:hypothetical protein
LWTSAAGRESLPPLQWPWSCTDHQTYVIKNEHWRVYIVKNISIYQTILLNLLTKFCL